MIHNETLTKGKETIMGISECEEKNYNFNYMGRGGQQSMLRHNLETSELIDIIKGSGRGVLSLMPQCTWF